MSEAKEILSLNNVVYRNRRYLIIYQVHI